MIQCWPWASGEHGRSAEVKFVVCDNSLAFKASISLPTFQGDLFDSDNHGGQQYAPLMDIKVPGL